MKYLMISAGSELQHILEKTKGKLEYGADDMNLTFLYLITAAVGRDTMAAYADKLQTLNSYTGYQVALFLDFRPQFDPTGITWPDFDLFDELRPFMRELSGRLRRELEEQRILRPKVELLKPGPAAAKPER